MAAWRDGMRYVEKLWSLRHGIILLVVLQAFDVLSTLLALEAPGTREANPLMRHAFESAGGLGLLLPKQAAIALVFLGVWLDPLESPAVRRSIAAVNVLYGAVLSMNFASYGMATGDWRLPAAFWALALAIAAVAVDETFFAPRPAPVPAADPA